MLLPLVVLALKFNTSVHAYSLPALAAEAVQWSSEISPSKCPQPPYFPPSPSSSYFDTPQFANISLRRLQGAIRHPTQSFDDLRDPETDSDPRWATFPPFHTFLRETYPLVHERLQLEIVGGYTLLYTWKGFTNASPFMFAAHQDVVPATSGDQWRYPPFEGHFDGEWIWGRGSSDCKSNLIGLLSVAEYLLSIGYKPHRTILFAFGQDEEVGGRYGASRLGPFLMKRYGKHGIRMILDEGGNGLSDEFGPLIAMPALAEKGYVDVYIHVQSPGGHSSVPGKHSSIGFLSHIISELEDAEIYHPILEETNPYYGYVECLVQHVDRAKLPEWLPKLAEDHQLGQLAEHLAEQSLTQRYLLQTSKAVTIFHGGEKNNALPEDARAVINSRIEITSSVKEHIAKITEFVTPVVAKYNLSLVAFDKQTLNGSEGTVNLILGGHNEPSPITKRDTPEWTIFSSAIRSAFGQHTTAASALMTGNTDTKHYWDVSKNIYRWTPARLGTRLNAHTINERIMLRTHVEAAKFYHGESYLFIDVWIIKVLN
ncbi:hypothetical protein M231_00394 [Tremella mesenterica]|uniref:Peptidase M20 dimerisation domain-containing protein n=1 Tax=Tremella mesenterica TaxID=5217 RepID=A0A4Q1BW62_TREME|nr:hypothetical protein M231_00394 [Tremella mesenterica]